ncbi:MAG: NAD(P)H-dependent oxidoreductase [Clostridium sp.]|nr:NAD(P)H-dependent oxidoreductase [Clostridium sp.]
MKKMLIAYYSWSNGNTKRIAEQLKKETGADLIRIETEAPYKGSYNEVVDQGKREVDSGFQPKIQPVSVDLSQCDVIAVGTPTWWYTMAPAVLTFLTSNNFSGKTVIPFMTNGGWPGHVIEDMEAACPGARITLATEIRFDSEGGDKMETPQEEVNAWVAQVKAFCEQ